MIKLTRSGKETCQAVRRRKGIEMNKRLINLTLVLLAVALIASSAVADYPVGRAGSDSELRPLAGPDSGASLGVESSAFTGEPEAAPSLSAIQGTAAADVAAGAPSVSKRSWSTKVEGALRHHDMGVRPLNGQVALWYHGVASGAGNGGTGVAAENTLGPFGRPGSGSIEVYDQYRTPVPAPGAVLLGALGLGLIGGIRTNKRQSN